MKCETCGGSLIYHPGNCLEQAVVKCMACGRPAEGEGKMESIPKRCSKCLRDLPIESFHKNKTTNDGLERWCKDCKKKASQDYRSKKAPASRGRSHLRAGRRRTKTLRVRDRSGSETKVRAPAKAFPTVTRATPEQIIAGLRRGLAIEIIDMIQEKFGL